MNIAQDFIKKLSMSQYRGANLLVLRKTEGANRDSTFAELRAAAGRMFGAYVDRIWRVTQEPMGMECLTTGNRIVFRGLYDVRQREKIKSLTFQQGKLTWIWLEEATEFSEADLDILDDRLRGRLENKELFYQITLTFNPVSANHWIRRRFFDGAAADAPAFEQVFCHHSTFLDNAFIDKGYAQRMALRKRHDPAGYRVYALGEWGESEGLIFQNYTVRPVETEFSFYDDIAMGQDFGFNHANAILLVGMRDGDLYILRELYVKGLDTGELLQRAAGIFPRGAPMYCDSAEPDRIRTWRQHGYMARAVKKEPGSVAAQIDWILMRRIFIAPDCVNTIAEIGAWKWQKDESSGLYTDRPVPFFDDAMAALRYSVEGWRRGRQVSF